MDAESSISRTLMISRCAKEAGNFLAVVVEWNFFIYHPGSPCSDIDPSDDAPSPSSSGTNSTSEEIHSFAAKVIEKDSELTLLLGLPTLTPLSLQSRRRALESELGCVWVVSQAASPDQKPTATATRLLSERVKLETPVMGMNDGNTFRILNVVTRVLRQRCLFKVDNSCALNVRFALNSGPLFTVLHLKKVGTLLWFAEGRLRQLCHGGGLTEEGRQNYTDCVHVSWLSKDSLLARKLAFDPRAPTLEPLDGYRIWMGNVIPRGNEDLLWRFMVFWSERNNTLRRVARLLIPRQCLGSKLGFGFESCLDSTGAAGIEVCTLSSPLAPF